MRDRRARNSWKNFNIGGYRMKTLSVTSSALALVLSNTSADAQSVATGSVTESQATVDEVIVTGTHLTGVKAADSAAPIQVVGADALQRVGQQDLTRALAQNLPSLNVQAIGADTAKSIWSIRSDVAPWPTY
jgi:iron complex outermembrane receptor protein